MFYVKICPFYLDSFVEKLFQFFLVCILYEQKLTNCTISWLKDFIAMAGSYLTEVVGTHYVDA